MKEQQFQTTVLVVDDDSIFHFLMKKTLPRLGIMPESIQTALNGKDAIDLITKHQAEHIPLPDIILLDLNMPIMGGFGFLEQFNKLTPEARENIKVIIISSSLNDKDMNKALTLGASKYLTKPVTDQELEQLLR